MITPDGPAAAALASRARGPQWLVELNFTTGTVRYTTNPQTLVIGGLTYIGIPGGLTNVSSVTESEDASVQKITLSFSVVNTSMLAASLGSVETYRGRLVRLYLQMMDVNHRQIGAPIHRWSGYMEPVRITRKSPDKASGSGAVGTIELPCSRAGMARARNQQGLRLTNAQQQQRFPGDRGLEYIQPLIEKPSDWLSVKFQRE